jgi:hypothetical protein
MARSIHSKGLKDKKYVAFVGSLPCVVCESRLKRSDGYIPHSGTVWVCQVGRSEVAHVGDRGLSQKSSDRETIPLCAEHHRTGKDAHHVLGRKFWQHHGLDRDTLIAELNARYEQEKAA